MTEIYILAGLVVFLVMMVGLSFILACAIEAAREQEDE